MLSGGRVPGGSVRVRRTRRSPAKSHRARSKRAPAETFHCATCGRSRSRHEAESQIGTGKARDSPGEVLDVKRAAIEDVRGDAHAGIVVAAAAGAEHGAAVSGQAPGAYPAAARNRDRKWAKAAGPVTVFNCCAAGSKTRSADGGTGAGLNSQRRPAAMVKRGVTCQVSCDPQGQLLHLRRRAHALVVPYPHIAAAGKVRDWSAMIARVPVASRRTAVIRR